MELFVDRRINSLHLKQQCRRCLDSCWLPCSSPDDAQAELDAADEPVCVVITNGRVQYLVTTTDAARQFHNGVAIQRSHLSKCVQTELSAAAKHAQRFDVRLRQADGKWVQSTNMFIAFERPDIFMIQKRWWSSST